MTTKQESILIVDDEEMLRWILNRKLSKEGSQCDEAGNSEEALDKLKSRPSELVVLDIEMPGKPGNELLPEIQAIHPDTAVIMASGVTDTRIIAQCIKDGAEDYIRKPFVLADLMLSVGRALEKQKLVSQIHEHQKMLGQNAEEPTPEIRNLYLGAVESLVCSLESDSTYTAGHSLSVTEIAMSIGRQLNMSPADLDDLYWGALLHDVGKIAVDPHILNKPGAITPEEYRHIMTHAIVGPKLVKPFVNDKVVDIISHHHDRYDGNRADQILAGEDIPLGARIVAMADAFNAMTSERPYRPAMSRMEAVREVKRCSGTQFRPLDSRYAA